MTKHNKNIDELAKSMRQYIDDPVPFVQNVLKAQPDKWQIECLRAIANHPRVAVRSGHGVGKTALDGLFCGLCLRDHFLKCHVQLQRNNNY